MYSERPKLYTILAYLSAVGLRNLQYMEYYCKGLLTAYEKNKKPKKQKKKRFTCYFCVRIGTVTLSHWDDPLSGL